LCGVNWDVVFVDGPYQHRLAMLDNMEYVPRAKTYVFHDTNRPIERIVVDAFARHKASTAEYHTEGDYWAVIHDTSV